MMLLPAYTPRLPRRIYQEDALSFFRAMSDESVHCIVTSPPYYGLRDYGVSGQLGVEATPAEYVARLVAIFHEARRVLRKDGTFWLNLGDTYASSSKGSGGPSSKQLSNAGSFHNASQRLTTGLPDKNLLMIPARVAIALQDDGWTLRSEIVWAKTAPMPESVKDRPTRSHEMVYLLTRSAKYWYDAAAIAEEAVEGKDLGLLRCRHAGLEDKVAWRAPSIKKRQDAGVDSRSAGTGLRNKRDVWTVTSASFSGAHFATFPPKLIEPMILAGCPAGGVVCDPFMGAGTTAIVALENHRQYIGCDINPAYIELANNRPTEVKLPMFETSAQVEVQG